MGSVMGVVCVLLLRVYMYPFRRTCTCMRVDISLASESDVISLVDV